MFSTNRARFDRRVAAVFFLVLALTLPALAAALTPEQKLIAAIPFDGDHAGAAVAISGATAVVGAPDDDSGIGAAYVFTRSGTTWTNVATLTADSGSAGDHFGTAVSISGGVIAVGAPGVDAGHGAVYVFTGSGSSWTQITTLVSSRGSAGDLLGSAVSVQGYVVAVGAPGATSLGYSQAGAAFIFSSTNNGSTWQQFTLPLNNGQAGNGDHFGTTVSLSGNTVLVGSPDHDQGNRTDSGIVQVFVNDGSQWLRQHKFNGNVDAGRFGASVAIYSDTAIVGAPGVDGGRGAVYVYTRSGTAWHSGPIVPGIASGGHFGASVALSGQAAAAGAPDADSSAGAAYFFDALNPSLATLDAGDSAAGDQFGASVAVDAGRAVVGSPFNSNSTHAMNGAAYVFLFGQPTITSITNIAPEPGALGQQYAVTVQVTTDPATMTVPTGTVDISDPYGASCIGVPLDMNGMATCDLTSFNAGYLTISANYSGDVGFSASNTTAQHHVIGFSFVFVQQPGDLPSLNDVSRAGQLDGVTVEEHDDSDALVAADTTTQVMLSLSDPCASVGTITFGPVTVTNGIADFTNVGRHFYTLTSGGALQLTATAVNALVSPASSSLFDVVDPPVPEFIFANDFEVCRL